MFHAGPGLHESDRQKAQKHHQQQPDVDGPEGEAERPRFPFKIGGQAAQTEQHQPNSQGTVHAEQSGMPMHRRCIQALHIVQGHRRVDEEAEQPRTNEVPESHGHEEVNRPFVGFDPRTGSRQSQVLIGFESNQAERNDLQSAECRTEGQHPNGRAAEIEMVERADDPAEQKDDRREEYRTGGHSDSQQAHASEQEGHHHRGEHLEEAFDPEMDNPPAPIFGDRQMGMLPPHQARDVEQRNRGGGQQEQDQQVTRFTAFFQRGPDRPGHQEQPKEQSDGKENLPEPA
ncbi:hypothetical protein D3C81_774590 [compost metagenome]